MRSQLRQDELCVMILTRFLQKFLLCFFEHVCKYILTCNYLIKKKQFYEKVAYISSNVTIKFKKENMINYRKQCTINIVYIKKIWIHRINSSK